MPLVSVIMSVYNGDKHLEESLSSIINQSFLDWELIVVNDFSKDNSGKIIQRAMQEDGRIRCIENKENLGLAASLNLAIEESSGQYIARMDDDDIALTYRLEKQVGYLEANDHVGVIGGRAELIGAKNGIRRHAEKDLDIKNRTLFSCQFCHPTAVIRRELLERSGIRYDESFRTAQDYKLWVDLLPHATFHNLSENVLKYRVHSGQVSATKRQEQKENTHRIYQVMLERMGLSVTDEMLHLHEAIASFSYQGQNMAEVSLVRDHLYSLIQANTAKPYFPQDVFSSFLSELFYNILKRSSISKKSKVQLYFDNDFHRYFKPSFAKLKLAIG